jgi:predicted Ser/Thr protein kinase
MTAVDLNRDQWQQIKAVLTSALKVSASERVALLQQAFAHDAFLRDCALEMLQYYDTATQRFDSVATDDRAPARETLREGALVGQSLGSYRVVRKLGEGGMGMVYLAEDQRLGRLVALKFISGGLHASASDAQAQLLAESRSVAALNHPGIVTLHDVLEVDGELVTVMEYVEGRPLSDLIDGAPLPLGFALRLACQLADALGYAHGRGIVHCDLKPANIHVLPNGTPKILDFGLARMLADSSGGSEQDGPFFGTPGYLAPERLLGRGAAAAADVYALGVICYELLTGSPPFRFEDQRQLFVDTVTATPSPPSSLVAAVPPAVDDVVLRCLAKSPRDRLQPHEIARALNNVLQTLDTTIAPRTEQDARAAGEVAPVRGQAGVPGHGPAGSAAMWRYARPVIGVAVVAAASGLLASWTFNSVVGRPLAFDPDSMARRFFVGLQSLVLPAVVMGATLGILSSLQLAGSFIQARAHSRWRLRMRARMATGGDTVGPTLAAVAIAGGLISLGVVFLLFGDVVDAMAARLASDDPALLRPLRPASREHQIYFRMAVSALLMAFAVSWRVVERTVTARGAGVPAGLRGAAIVVMALFFVLAQAPYRLTLQNERPVALVDGQRCYVLGQSGDETRVYCPGWNPPRVRTVLRGVAAVVSCGFEENLFVGTPGVTCQ